MKQSLSLALISAGVAQAVLGPGYEDYLYCPEGDCEIYINPFGYVGPVSMSNKCFDTTTGQFSNGVWTGELTNVTVPEGWTQPEKCTEAQYTQCFTAEECSLQVGPGCSCYVSSTIFPFDASSFQDSSCTGNECDGYEAECSAGENGEGNTCMIKFNIGELPTTVSTVTGATEPATGGDSNATTVAPTEPADGGNKEGGGVITTTTTTTTVAPGSGAAASTEEPSSGNVAIASISLLAVSAVIFNYLS